MTAQVYVVLEYEDDWVSHVVGVFDNAPLAKRVAARNPQRVVWTAPLNRELRKAKA